MAEVQPVEYAVAASGAPLVGTGFAEAADESAVAVGVEAVGVEAGSIEADDVAIVELIADALEA